MVPSGIVSLTRLALPHSVFAPAVDFGSVGNTNGTTGVRVGINCNGPSVAAIVGDGSGVSVATLAFCAATVWAIAVEIDGSGVDSAPQAVSSNVRIVVKVRALYFTDLNIFFLSFTDNYYTVKRTAPGKYRVLY